MKPLVSLHEALERSPSFSDLGQAGWRTAEVRQEFLIFINRLIAFAGSLVELAKIVVG